MKKLNLKAIKKQVVALGLAAVMLLGMGSTAYADDWQMNMDEFTTPDFTYAYMDPGSWFGEFEVAAPDGSFYRINIHPYWDEPNVWDVFTSRFLPGQSYAATMWDGTVYAAPRFDKGTTLYDPESGFTAVAVTGTDPSDPELYLSIGYNQVTGEIYLTAEPTDTKVLENDQSVPECRQGLTGNDSVARASCNVGYKKVSDRYLALFTGWTEEPEWYTEWMNDRTTSKFVNWDTQCSTPDGQAPVTEVITY